MKISLCEIVLRRITKDDIELLRQWRNDPKISSRMFYREYITPKMQANWFASLQPENDFYFFIEIQGKPIGLIHLNRINLEKSEAESGLFIYDENYWGTHIPIHASLALLQFAFEEKKLNTILVKILPNNKEAKRYNQFLGFDQTTDTQMVLNKENYLNVTQKLLKKLLKID